MKLAIYIYIYRLNIKSGIDKSVDCETEKEIGTNIRTRDCDTSWDYVSGYRKYKH